MLKVPTLVTRNIPHEATFKRPSAQDQSTFPDHNLEWVNRKGIKFLMMIEHLQINLPRRMVDASISYSRWQILYWVDSRR